MEFFIDLLNFFDVPVFSNHFKKSIINLIKHEIFSKIFHGAVRIVFIINPTWLLNYNGKNDVTQGMVRITEVTASESTTDSSAFDAGVGMIRTFVNVIGRLNNNNPGDVPTQILAVFIKKIKLFEIK